MIDVVLITTGQRFELLKQSLQSLDNNKHDHSTFSLSIVWDCQFNRLHEPNQDVIDMLVQYGNVLILRMAGASRARNIGASSIPKYRRQKWVLFADDDTFWCDRWDEKLIEVGEQLPRHLISPYGHPFNIEETVPGIAIAKFPLLISSVAAFMSWDAWDEIGYWIEPGGPSSSEDYEYCQRAQRLGYSFAVLNPHRVIHCGTVSSNGDKIVGYDELTRQNTALINRYELQGKIRFNG